MYGHGFTAEQRRDVREAVASKINVDAPCPLCGSTRWNIQDSYVSLPVQRRVLALLTPEHFEVSEISFVALICVHCGGTQFLKADVLQTHSELIVIPGEDL